MANQKMANIIIMIIVIVLFGLRLCDSITKNDYIYNIFIGEEQCMLTSKSTMAISESTMAASESTMAALESTTEIPFKMNEIWIEIQQNKIDFEEKICKKYKQQVNKHYLKKLYSYSSTKDLSFKIEEEIVSKEMMQLICFSLKFMDPLNNYIKCIVTNLNFIDPSEQINTINLELKEISKFCTKFIIEINQGDQMKSDPYEH